MINYSVAPIKDPEYIDVTPGGDVIELGKTEISSDDGAFYDSETTPSIGVYDSSGRLNGGYETALPFKITKENASSVTQAINQVRQLLFLDVPKDVIRAGFAANAAAGLADAELQYQFVNLFIGD